MRTKRFTIALVAVTLLSLIAVAPVTAQPQPGNIIHVVQSGETLYSIARHYGVAVETVARANGIVNPNYIYAGQRLVIPGGQPAATIHLVQPGETLLRIALRYGVDAWTIARANGITNLNHIYVGQRLTIPVTAPPPSQPTATPRPFRPASFPGPWSGEYFDNATLTGSAYATRQDEAVNFNWGWGPPAGGMPTNSFSARWSGNFHFDAGTYRFYAQVDDGVRVYVDGELIINGWRDGGLRLYTANRALAAGDHEIKVEYYDRIQVARVYFWWAKVSATTPTPTPAATVTPGPSSTPTPGPSPTPTSGPSPTPTPTSTPAPGTGWFGQYYNNIDLQEPPFVTRYDPWIGADWGTDSPMPGMPRDFFSIRWTTQVHLEEDDYLFCAMSDDGARIWVDGTRVLDEWHPNNGVAYCGRQHVKTGNHDIKVEYYEEGGNALIYVWWRVAD